MPFNVNLSPNRAKPQPEQNSGTTPPTVSPAARKIPFANLPRRVLIGGGTALLVILIGGLWFLFGYGPEDSGRAAAASADSAPARQNPTGNAVGAGGTTSATTPTVMPGQTAQPSASRPASERSAYDAETGGNPNAPAVATPTGGNTYARGNGQSNPADPNGGAQTHEVEGSPPMNSGAGGGSTWHPTDKPGAVITHGPASDP